MQVLLDTDDLPPEQRLEAFWRACERANVSCAVRPDDSAQFRAHLEYRDLGPTATVYRHEGTGVHVSRDITRPRTATPQGRPRVLPT